MTAAARRQVMHVCHAVATVVLIATGFLIQWPDLRAALVGGYGRQLAEYHMWFGWLFAAVPLAGLGAARALLADARRRLGPPDGVTWRKLHIVVSVVSSFLLSVTGIVLWAFPVLPALVEDVSLEIHVWATWVLTVSLPIHLVAARRAIVERLRHPRGGEPPPLFEFDDDEEEELDVRSRASSGTTPRES